MADLTDYNKSEINHIDQCRKELLSISKEYVQLIKRVSTVFNKIESLDLSKEVQNPCTECLVQPSCQFRQEIKAKGFPTMSMHMKMGDPCQAKIKSLILSNIKKEKDKMDFISTQTGIFHRDMIAVFLGQNPEEAIYPEWWILEGDEVDI